MKLKFLGALVTLGLVGCAVFGAGSASATYLCKANLNPCPEASRYPVTTEWKFKLVSGAKLTVKSPMTFEATCTGSEFGGILLSQGLAEPAKASMTTHSVTGCTELYPGCVGTTTVTPTENFEMQFTSKGSGGEGEEALWRRGRFILSAPCTNATSKCKYAAFNQKVYEEKGQAAAYEKGNVIWHITGGSQATNVTGFLGQVEGGAGCPGSLEISGNFEIVKPVPLYLI